MNEEQVRTKLVRWARWHWGGEADLPEPEVEILSLKEVEENDYEAELWISSSEDNPLVTFFIDDAGRLQVMAVEY